MAAVSLHLWRQDRTSVLNSFTLVWLDHIYSSSSCSGSSRSSRSNNNSSSDSNSSRSTRGAPTAGGVHSRKSARPRLKPSQAKPSQAKPSQDEPFRTRGVNNRASERETLFRRIIQAKSNQKVDLRRRETGDETYKSSQERLFLSVLPPTSPPKHNRATTGRKNSKLPTTTKPINTPILFFYTCLLYTSPSPRD